MLCVLTALCQAQSAVKVAGNVAGLHDSLGNKMFVERYEGDAFGAFDSVNIERSGNFRYCFSSPPEGVYRLRFPQHSNGAQFIVNARVDSAFSIYATVQDWQMASVDVVGSIENDVYARLSDINLALNDSIRRYTQIAKGIDRFDPQAQSKKSFLDLRAERLFNHTNDKIAGLAKEWPKTYTARVLAPMATLPRRTSDFDNDPAFLHRHFFDNVPFGDPGILAHNAYSDALATYIGNYSVPSEEGRMALADYVMKLAAAHPEVERFTLFYLMQTLIRERKEKALAYTIEKYGGGCETETKTDALVRALLNTQPGKYADAELLAFEPPLDKYCRMHKAVLLYFWLSDCEHCQRAGRVLKELYAKYHAKGMGIFSVCLDDKPADIEYDWPTLRLGDARKNPKFAESFLILSTPTFFLLDSEARYQKRWLKTDELPFILSNLFEKP